MRRDAKIDANHRDIVQALRKIGAKVCSLATVGKHCPDLLVGFRGRNVLIEVKAPGGKPSRGQIEFMETWPGETHIVYNVNEAMSAVIGKDALK